MSANNLSMKSYIRIRKRRKKNKKVFFTGYNFDRWEETVKLSSTSHLIGTTIGPEI